MIDNEARDILQKEFDKNQNYQTIMNNIEQYVKQKNSKKKNKLVMKYVMPKILVPTCVAISIFAVVVINKNNNETNNAGKTTEDNNTSIVSEIQNNDKVIVNEIIENTIEENNFIEQESNNANVSEIKDNKDIDKKDVKKDNKQENNTKRNINDTKETENQQKKEEITDKQNNNKIYKSVQVQAANWAKDPSNPENLLNERTSVIKAKIISIEEATMLPKQENFNNPYCPYTPITIQIVENLSGNQISGNIKAYMQGGKIKIGSLSDSEASNLGISNITEGMKSQYMQFKTGYDYVPNVGNEYVIIVTKTNNNLYQIGTGGYSIFSIESNGNIKNVLTGKQWKI